MKSMSIVEFAKRIGLSPTTVSQAINGRGRVSPATRELVRRRMVELGYVPNVHAQQLVTGRSRMVVLHHTNQDLLTDLFLIELVHGIQHALHRRGYGLLLDTASDFSENDSLLNRWLMTGAVDGTILIQGWSDITEWVKRFASRRTPIVAFGRLKESGIPHTGRFALDHRDAIGQVARHLAENGHRRIGYLGIHESEKSLDVFRAALAEYGAAVRDDHAVIAGFTPVDGARAFRELLGRPEPPTAVFCRKDDLALGALAAASQMGIRIPEQLSLVGHDDVPLASVTDPPLTTIRVDCAALGEAAVELLFQLLENPDAVPDPIVTQARLVIRSSVAPVCE